MARTAGNTETGDGDFDAMTDELIILAYIAVALTVNLLMNIVFYVSNVNWRRECIHRIACAMNLLAERTDNNDGK